MQLCNFSFIIEKKNSRYFGIAVIEKVFFAIFRRYKIAILLFTNHVHITLRIQLHNLSLAHGRGGPARVDMHVIFHCSQICGLRVILINPIFHSFFVRTHLNLNTINFIFNLYSFKMNRLIHLTVA